MMYFEDARLEFLGVPLAYMPYFSAPDPTVKRKTGVLIPTYSTSTVYGFAATVPYYLALAPNYDFTFTPMITTRQGPLLQGEWRHRLVNGAYADSCHRHLPARQGPFRPERRCDAGLSRLARQPGNVGPVQSLGQMDLGLGRDAGFGQDLSCRITASTKPASPPTCSSSTPDYALSQLYLAGRGDRSYFDARTHVLSTASRRPTTRSRSRSSTP